MEISNLPNKDFMVMITKTLNELGRRMSERRFFNKELENIKNHTELKNTITKMKGINNRLDDTEE